MKMQKVSCKKVINYAFKNECKIFIIYNFGFSSFFKVINLLNESEIISYKKTNYYSSGKGWNCNYYIIKLAHSRKKVIIAEREIRATAKMTKFKRLHTNLIEILEDKAEEILDKFYNFKNVEKSGFEFRAEKVKLAIELERLANLALD